MFGLTNSGSSWSSVEEALRIGVTDGAAVLYMQVPDATERERHAMALAAPARSLKPLNVVLEPTLIRTGLEITCATTA